MNLCCNCGQVGELQQSGDIHGTPVNDPGRQLPPTVTTCVRCSKKAGVSIGNADEARSLAKSSSYMVSESARSLDMEASLVSLERDIDVFYDALNNIESRLNDTLLAIKKVITRCNKLSAGSSPNSVEGNQRNTPKCRRLPINCKRKDEH